MMPMRDPLADDDSAGGDVDDEGGGGMMHHKVRLYVLNDRGQVLQQWGAYGETPEAAWKGAEWQWAHDHLPDQPHEPVPQQDADEEERP